MFRTIMILSLSFVVLSAFGCGGKQQTLKDFNRVLETYNHQLAIKDVEMAARFVEPSKRMEFFTVVEKMLADVNVSDIRVRSVVFNEKHDKAQVVMIREYFDSSTYEVRSMQITQEWEKKKGDWKLVGGAY